MKTGMTVTSPIGTYRIDASVTQPDGVKLYRVNDHWFDARYLTNT